MMSTKLLLVAIVALAVSVGFASLATWQNHAEQEERETLRAEIERLRGQMGEIEAKLAARSAEPKRPEVDLLESAREPEATAAGPQKVLVVTPAGVLVDGKVLEGSALDTMLAELAATQPPTSLVVRAEKGASHQHVTALLDRAKAAGVQRFALASPSADEPTPD